MTCTQKNFKKFPSKQQTQRSSIELNVIMIPDLNKDIGHREHLCTRELQAVFSSLICAYSMSPPRVAVKYVGQSVSFQKG